MSFTLSITNRKKKKKKKGVAGAKRLPTPILKGASTVSEMNNDYGSTLCLHIQT